MCFFSSRFAETAAYIKKPETRIVNRASGSTTALHGVRFPSISKRDLAFSFHDELSKLVGELAIPNLDEPTLVLLVCADQDALVVAR